MWQELEEQLTCSLCLDTFTDPRTLQCLHVFCKDCVNLAISGQQLTCPNCRQVMPVPASGVAGLPAAFQIKCLLEIVNKARYLHPSVAAPTKTRKKKHGSTRISEAQLLAEAQLKWRKQKHHHHRSRNRKPITK